MVRRRMRWSGRVAKLIEVTRGIYPGVDVVDFDCVHALIVSVADRLQSQERIDAATLSLEMP